jgi:hypothetical protein
MNATLKAAADKQIAEYSKAPARFRKARVAAAVIQANAQQEGSENQAYWLYIATSLAA